MRALQYAFREACVSLWRRRSASLFAVVAIGLAIVVLGALLLLTSNVERLVADWSSAAEFSVYLRDDATPEQRDSLEAIIQESGLAAVRRVGLMLVFVMMAAAALTVAAVVRLALYARRDELEIMHLVGSPYAYIRGPFVAEGLLQGGLGAGLALTVLWLGFRVALAWWGSALSAVVDPGRDVWLVRAGRHGGRLCRRVRGGQDRVLNEGPACNSAIPMSRMARVPVDC